MNQKTTIALTIVVLALALLAPMLLMAAPTSPDATVAPCFDCPTTDTKRPAFSASIADSEPIIIGYTKRPAFSAGAE